MLIHQGHDATSRVERRIGEISFLFSRPSATAPFPTVTKCDSVPPSWEQSVSENSLVAFYGCVRLGADRFGALNQLVFCVVLSQVSKGQSASHIYPVDRNMESVDLGPCTSCVRKMSDQPYRDFAFHPFAIRFTSNAEEQYPGFALSALFLVLASRAPCTLPLIVSTASLAREEPENWWVRRRGPRRIMVNFSLCATIQSQNGPSCNSPRASLRNRLNWGLDVASR